MSRVDKILDQIPAMTTGRELARRSDPASSFEAARKVEASGARLRAKQRLTLAVFRRPGKTAGEYAELTGLDRYTVGRRLPDLVRDGVLMKGQIRRCRVMGTRQLTWFPATEPEERQRELW